MGNACKKSSVKSPARKEPIDAPENENKKRSSSSIKEEILQVQGEELPDVNTTPDTLDPVLFNPEEEQSITPEEEKSITPEIEKSVTPENEKSITPVKEESIAPQNEISITPQKKISITSQKEISITPQKEESITPQKEKSITPQKEKSVTPQKKISITPQKEESITPQKEESITPQKEKSITPQKEKSITPQKEKSITPQKEKSITPQKEKSKTPSPVPPSSKTSKSEKEEFDSTPTSPPQPMSPHIVPPTFETVQKVPGELTPFEKLQQAAESDSSVSTLETPRVPVRRKTESELIIRRRRCPDRLRRIGAALVDWDAIERAIEKMTEGCLLDHHIKCKFCKWSDFSDTPLLN